MSSFSSIIRKPGQKIVPKGAPRRNAKSRAVIEPTHIPESQQENAQQTNQDANGVEETILPSEGHQSRPDEPPPTPENSQPTIANSDTRPATNRSSLPLVRSTTPVVHVEEPREPNLDGVDDQEVEVEGQGTAQALESPRGPERSITTEEGSRVESAIPITEPTVPAEEVIIPSTEPSTISASPSSPHKRRKTTPAVASETAPVQTRITVSPAVQPVNRAPSQSRNDQSQSPEDLFRSATSRAASVSEQANRIDERTRSRSQVQRDSVDQHAENDGSNTAEPAATPTPATTKRKRRNKTIQEQAAEVVASAMGGSSHTTRRRDVTPEDAETRELDPDQMTMGNLCKNSKIGKKSALEAEMEANWPEILQRRKEDHDRALEAAQSRKRKAYSKLGPQEPLQATAAVGPQQMIVNGKIVVVSESREIDRSAQLTQAAVLDETNVREDKDYYKRVNQATVGIKANHGRRFRWDDESTQKFFKGLRMFGTDFMMIANMFPGMDRKQIKMKFIREENADKAGVMQHLQNREEIDMEEYSEVANIEFEDVQKVEDEIKAEEQRLRAEDNERRKREGFAVNESDIPLPSREGEDGVTEGSGTAQAGEDGPGRYAELAADIMAPKKKQRKTNASSKKRGPKAGRRPEGGVEEVLGSIDEVQI